MLDEHWVYLSPATTVEPSVQVKWRHKAGETSIDMYYPNRIRQDETVHRVT